MTMNPSAVAHACLSPSRFQLRRRAAFALLAFLTLLALLANTDARAGSYVGVGIGVHDGTRGYQGYGGDADGWEIHAGVALSPRWAIELGVIDQRGDFAPAAFFDPGVRTDFGWRALHVGPKLRLPLGERWYVDAGVGLAHVAFENDVVGLVVDEDGTGRLRNLGERQHSSWGWLAAIGLGVQLGERHALELQWRRLHAALAERCVEHGPSLTIRCGLPEHGDSDGLGLRWSLRFD